MILYLLWLSLVDGIGPVAIKKLLECFTEPREVYRADYEDLLAVSGIGKATAANLVEARSLQAAETILARCDKQNINILTCLDAAYPDNLMRAPHAPPLLYYMGAEPRCSGVALVGSRKCSAYGKEVACEAAAYLALHNVPVVSGMAAGVDGYAHTSCLKAGGYTMAFVGGGVDVVYPSEHRVLQQKIAATGTIVSPFPPGTPAHAARFARRNYLMAAWAETIVIVEAGHKSGALLTADYGLQLGKRVMAVPGSIYSRQSIGTNLLLTQGAELYSSPAQLTGSVTTKPGYADTEDILGHTHHQTANNNPPPGGKTARPQKKVAGTKQLHHQARVEK